MIIENNKGNTKEVKIMMTIKQNKKKYILYYCDDLFLHVGIIKNKKLMPINDSEYELISDILTKMNLDS